MSKETKALAPRAGAALAPLEIFAQIPEEGVWLSNFPSRDTRAAYRASVAHFITSCGLKSSSDFRKVTPAAVIAWRDKLLSDGKAIRTVKSRLSALRSLFDHLAARGLVDKNPAAAVKAPKLRVRRGETKALTPKQARKLLDTPPPGTLQGLRDRAILAVGLHVGARRAEIAGLKVRDFHEESEFPALKLKRKGGAHGSVVIHQAAAQRISTYLEESGHTEDKNGPLFRAVRRNQATDIEDRHLLPKQIDRIVQRWCREARLPEGFTSHSLRATFITTALSNGAPMEDVQRDAGHAHSSTTQLYDRRGYNPERSASLFATY